MSELLEIRGLTAGYDGAPVVRDLDLTVRQGEIVALLGPNGAGKTTALRAITNVLRPMAGDVSIGGIDNRNVATQRLARWGVAHVTEGRGIFSGLTAAEHFRLGAGDTKIDSEIAFEYFPAIRELQHRKAGLLSGGEQQMLALACALGRRPKLLLVDELSLGLAPVIVERLLPVLRNYADESEAGVLLVEQHVNLALDVADRGYVLSHGSVQLHEPADVLRENNALLIQSYLGESSNRNQE